METIIREKSNYSLLEMFDNEIRRNHYDPVDDMEVSAFSISELRNEIIRRMELK